MDRIGQQLGRYRILRLLGTGGFAEVYLGEHIRLNTKAAIKVLHTRLEDKQMEDFLNEALTVARLDHSNIVRVMDFDVQAGIPFLVMTYVPNGTLRQRHPLGQRLTIATIIPYVKQAADALQYAHESKLIHRDIKPENLLVGQHNEILLSDFGIATLARTLLVDAGQKMAGTAAYMAPEQIQGYARYASDQYALGIIVYEWLAGERPFSGTFVETCSQHLYANPPSLRAKNPEVSPDVEQVVFKALQKDPSQRFPSVRVFAEALVQASQDTLPTEQSRPLSTSSPMYTHSQPSDPSMSSPPTVSVPQPQQQPVELSIRDTALPDRFTPLPPPVLHTPPALPIPVKTTDKSVFRSRFIALNVIPSLALAMHNIAHWTFALVRGESRKRSLPFRPIARIELEENDRAAVGKLYTIEAGIAPNRSDRFTSAPFALPSKNPTDPIWFDLALHTSDNIVQGETWHQRLRYDPRNVDLQLVTFSFHFATPGHGFVTVTFFHELRWLRTLRFEIETIEQPTRDAATEIG